MPLQVPATPLTKREDQERMADSVHRVAKQRRPRLSVGSSRMPGMRFPLQTIRFFLTFYIERWAVNCYAKGRACWQHG